MAVAAREARDAGASVVHIHYREQAEGRGHEPSWDPRVAADVCDAIRAAVPDVLINQTTGTIGTRGALGGGELGPTGGPIACIDAARPEIAALNSGSLNYLKATSRVWAWPPSRLTIRWKRWWSCSTRSVA